MNTNFKGIKRVFKLFLLFVFSTISFADINFNSSLDIETTKLIPLTLKKNSFIKGSYTLTSNVKKIELLDKNQVFIRRLDKVNSLKDNFYFLTYNNDSFFIKIINNNQKNTYNLKIEKQLLARYKEDAKAEPLSPIIQKQKFELKKNKDTTKFWNMVKKTGTPLIEHLKEDDYLITFLYKGAKHNVRLLGGPVSDHVFLDRLENSDIWFKSFKVKKGIRLSYQLAPDVPNIRGTKREKRVAILSTSQVDPFNKKEYKLSKNLELDKYSKYSTVEILADNFIDWTKDIKADKGKVLNTKIKSNILLNERKISIYIPNKFDYKKPHKLLFVFDGIDYQIKIPTPRILDNLIYKKKILPTVAVFIDNPTRNSRSSELPPNKKFADFMAKELLPFVKSKIKIKQTAKDTILTGSSYGGLASMYVAFSYPELFGNVLSQSGSFWWSKKDDKQPEWLTRQISKVNKKDLNIYLNAGIYETGYSSIDILESNRHLYTVLKAKGYENIIYEEYYSSHDYFAWRANLANGLISLSKM